MKVALFSVRPYEQEVFDKINSHLHEIKYIRENLNVDTAAAALGCRIVCCFVNDRIDADVLLLLSKIGVDLICLRSAGYNNVDVEAARRYGVTVVRAPDYSPHAVAEHAVALLLCLNRKVHRAFNRVRELNFSLDGLVGFDLYGKTVGVVGAGRIGRAFAEIMRGFGCRVLIYDRHIDPELQKFAIYTDIDDLMKSSDVVSLHMPLTPETLHLVNAERLAHMKKHAVLINTGRGALIDTKALIEALKHKQIGGAGLDVYEEEENIFFRDLSARGIDDDVLARLLTFPNVLVTAHQAFLTNEALKNIAETTLDNIGRFESGRELIHRVT